MGEITLLVVMASPFIHMIVEWLDDCARTQYYGDWPL